MISKILFKLLQYSWFKRLFWKRIYNTLAKEIPENDVRFMNYGYIPGEEEKKLYPLREDNGIQKFELQMYHFLIAKVKMEKKYILEVGCGRGGGASYIAEHFNPESYIGMDISINAIDLANKLYSTHNLKFIEGDAESIPLNDQSVDVVINVESSHSYGSVDNFLNEVKRVLKPGGYFLLADLRDGSKRMNGLKNKFKSIDMELLKEKDITQNVLNAIEEENESKQQYIKTSIPPKWQFLFSEYAGCVGFSVHKKLKNKEAFYYRFLLQKRNIS